MPQYAYRGRDKDGRLRTGQRFAFSVDNLNTELIKEGITPIQIKVAKTHNPFWHKIQDKFQGEVVYLQELSIFSRQMQLLHQGGVPMVIALRQLASHTRSLRLAHALPGVIENIEKGQSLAVALQQYPEAFSPLMINIIQIGESTGQLSRAFGQLHQYLEFEVSSIKQIKAAFRYPVMVLISIFLAIIALNVLVIPTFANFYSGMMTSLPWQTRVLIGMSNFTVDYGFYLLVIIGIGIFFLLRYFKTPKGKFYLGKFLLRIPVAGKILKRLILIRFAQSLGIILNSGVSMTHGLDLVKNTIMNSYIASQITQMQESIERGVPFTQALVKIELFTPLEIQILGVGEKNGELGPALAYISDFHSNEIAYDLKRMNDLIGPILITAISALILIIAMGVYLPVWNMINLMK